MLLGPAMMTLGIGLIAHRLKTVRLLATATTLMVLSGIGCAFETEFWPLLIIALVGTLSPTASDVSVFAPLEQTLISNAVVPQRRTSIFATYSLIGSVLSAIGCLFASAPEIVARAGLVPPNVRAMTLSTTDSHRCCASHQLSLVDTIIEMPSVSAVFGELVAIARQSCTVKRSRLAHTTRPKKTSRSVDATAS